MENGIRKCRSAAGAHSKKLWYLSAVAIAVVGALVFAGSGTGDPGGLSFLWPVDLPRQLSGTLGEVRGYTLHSGIDIKTKGRNGFPVIAAADGRLWRILSRETGYGNAVFVSHDEGLVSVYGHLDSFEEEKYSVNSIVSILKTLYMSESLDIVFRQSTLPFRRGEKIAFSGESGSGTSHLHFEIRGKNRYVNPLRMIRVADKEPPVIDAIYLCAEQNGTTVYERRVAVKKSWGGYKPDQQVIADALPGRLFFKISCFDRVNAINSVAVQRIVLREGPAKIFETVFDEIRDSDLRFGHFIYDVSKSTIDGTVTYTYFLCRRNGNGYGGMSDVNGGYIVPDGKLRNISVEVYDLAGNKSAVNLTLRISAGAGVENSTLLGKGKLNAPSEGSNRFVMKIGPHALAADMLMKIEELPVGKLKEISRTAAADQADIRALYAVRPFDVLYEKPVEVTIRTASAPNGSDVRRMSIYQLFDGKRPKRLATRYNAALNRFEAASRVNGYYALIRDTKPPEIFMPPTHEFIDADVNFIKLRLYVLDVQSELDTASLRAYIDGEIYPVKYDTDRKWIEMKLPRRAAAGRMHHLMLRCSDNAGNETVFRNLVEL